MDDNEGFVLNSTSTFLVNYDELDRLASVLFTNKGKPLLIGSGTYEVDVEINSPKPTLEFTVFRYELDTTSYFMFYPENEYGLTEWDGAKYTIEEAIKSYPPSRYEWYYKIPIDKVV